MTLSNSKSRTPNRPLMRITLVRDQPFHSRVAVDSVDVLPDLVFLDVGLVRGHQGSRLVVLGVGWLPF